MNLIKDGLFITIEGGEGSGKTTAAKAVVDALNNKGYSAVYFREPGSNETAEKIRDIAVNTPHIDPYVQLLLFSASRASIIDDIKAALDEGKIVIMDRYVLSTMVYQGHVGGIPMHYINNITAIATKGLRRPDMEFILDIPAEIGLERIRGNGREINEMDKLDITFHEKVNSAFKYSSYSLARRVIDATQSKDEVFHQIMEAINKII